MATLRALLEIHGTLDHAILTSADPRVGETVDLFLPGASANTEWYREIESFMFSAVEGGPKTEPSPIEALREIRGNRAVADQAPTIPEMSRLLYGVGAILRLHRVVPTVPGERLDEAGGNRDLLADILAMVGPEPSLERVDDEAVTRAVDIFAEEFTSWRAWYAVTRMLVADNLLSAEIAEVPLCKASVVVVNGIEAVVVDTEFSSDDVSLNGVKAVVDPRNWDDNYPHFFCSTVGKGKRADNWRKMLETVGTCDIPYSRRLVTMLKFFKSEVSAPGQYEARLDYDLNDPLPDKDSDGQITVDRGFINMWCTNDKVNPADPGVLVRTRKVAHITGLRPNTLKRFVCIFGYAFGAMEMLFGPAKNPDHLVGYYPWTDRPEDDKKEDAAAHSTKPAPAPSNNTVASTAIKMWVTCVEDLTVKNLDLYDKWMSGQLTVADLAAHSTEVGTRIAGDPWKFLQAISQPKGGGK